MKIKKGDIAEFKIEKYAFEGKGIAKVSKNDLLGINDSDGFEKNYVVFVHCSYPGDVVKARLTKIKKSYAEAITTEIISASPDRVKAKCKYFGVCGGCKQQDLSYQKQIEYKQKQVEEIFYKLGGFNNFEIENILPSDDIYFYRNKMEFSFSDKRWLTKQEISSADKFQKDFALGLHIPKIYDKVLDINECFLQSELSNSILNFTRKFFIEKNVSVYSTKTHTGFLRNLVIRQSYHTKDLMVNLVTSDEDDELLKEYVEQLVKNFPAITTIVNNISKKLSAVAVGDYEKVYFGSGFIYDKIGNYTFRISANSFFQTNTRQAEKLYQTALDYAELKGDEIVYDLYSGAGTIAIYISQKAREVFAFESVQSAVEDAKVNAELNSVSNVEFITTDLYKSFLPIIHKKNFPVPEVMIIDPPRSGMHQNTVEDVIQLSPKKNSLCEL
ncbi:23S rRNA (uracil(1939)-C(5))-methyltransferase RlmD [Ignavibacterium sp.]|uniref:23S rRNA (uracil(1939)-C(5))-methyltransferase RlmD n=1 Tax=Ignavibacterium sp. TaxID=2651167 RepID=UPI0022096E30|nr:23S rRNA (uracil(1939)-C(5))-methyltransferase RlmD [Ignavibacterium sp.]BDQ03216.1 MAG: putative RNA methyltransferase [Ignavibacterium sp.]